MYGHNGSKLEINFLLSHLKQPMSQRRNHKGDGKHFEIKHNTHTHTHTLKTQHTPHTHYSITYQNVWDAMKVVLRIKFITVNA